MICSFCRYANWEKGVKCCRNCKAELIRYIPLSKHEEDYLYRDNLRSSYLIKIRPTPRRTSIERKEMELNRFREAFRGCFAEILSALKSSRL